MRLRLALGVSLLAVLWGIAFVGIKEVLAEISPSTLTILRFAVADACLLALMAATPRARPVFARNDLWRLGVLALTGVPGYHLALNWGEARTSASVAALIVAVAPVMVALASAVVLRERITAARIVGIAAAFGGVILLAFGRPAEPGSETQLAGFFVALIAPTSWMVYTIVAKPLLARSEPMRVTATTLLAGSLFLTPFLSSATITEARALSASGWTWVILLGAGSSVCGYLLFVWALQHLSATRVSVMLYAVPIIGVLAAWAIRDEPLGWIVAASAGLVIGGVALVQRASDVPA